MRFQGLSSELLLSVITIHSKTWARRAVLLIATTTVTTQSPRTLQDETHARQ